MREVTIATVQMKPKLGEAEDNLVAMSEWISKIASQQKVDLIVFPELITSGNELGVRFTEIAQRVPGPTINLLAQRANEYGIYIAFGMVTKERVESVLYNSSVLVGPEGELIEVYNKIHLRGEERMAFREGYKLPIAETEIGNIGMMIGYDLAYPEVARSLALEGAEILCVMANWEAAQIDEWKTYLRARAYENSLFVVGANRVGEDVTLNFGGESMIVGPRGQIYASLAEETDPETGAPLEGFAVARIDLDDVRKNREEYQFIQTRQPAVYRSIVRKY
ncbi:MAG: carbon-nitrogen hydrolase family protein [Chloroflexi bacterium]|nr:MAG: carbon-nitrogen hydrolase family protein [Chloroflexota bacterium]